MSALITSVGHANFSGRKFVGNAEKAAVWTGVSAETFLSQKIDGHKSADEKKRNGDGDRRKSRPEFGSYQMICPLRNKRLVFRRSEKSVGGRIDEHIERDDQRHENQKARAKRFRRESEFF